ncbi:MAG: hypothetical protein ACRCT1_09235 [Microcoleaceae cyanobacterium]
MIFGKKEEGRRKKEEGRRKKEEGSKLVVFAINNVNHCRGLCTRRSRFF